MTQEDYTLRVREKGPCDRVLPLEPAKAELLAAVLCRALGDEPQFRYMMPDEPTRRRSLYDFFCSTIRACQSNGEAYTTPDVDAGALWIGPGSGLTLSSMMKAFPALLLQWDWASLRRCVNVVVHLDEVHAQLVKGRHWYLLTLGVARSEQDETLAARLLDPLLARADSDDLPCYLETFSAGNLRFYRTHGFRIAGGGRIPHGGPEFWAMIRKPQRPGHLSTS